MKSIKDWKKSIIHFESANKGMNSFDRRQGTAIFIKFKEWYFLITNKHLVENKSAKINDFPYYEYYFRIPSYDEINDIEKKEILEKKVRITEDDEYWTYVNYTEKDKGEIVFVPHILARKEFPDPKYSSITVHERLDLAVISLRPTLPQAFISRKNFATELIELGYQPISIEDITDEPSEESVDIYTIGYPVYISLISQRPDEIDEDLKRWSSFDITLPNLSFGKVSMLHKDIDYFWCDMRIFKGNSGGPVIENGKLVGIMYTRGYTDEGEFTFSKAVKAKYIVNLLEEQVEKNLRVAEHIKSGKIFSDLI